MWFISPLFYPQKMYLSSHKFPWNKKLPPTANLWDQASNASFLVGSWNPEFYEGSEQWANCSDELYQSSKKRYRTFIFLEIHGSQIFDSVVRNAAMFVFLFASKQ